MIDIDAIRKAAEAATPGPWERSGEFHVTGPNRFGVAATGGYHNSDIDAEALHLQKTANAELIANLDPATVLELCRLAEIGERFEEATESAKHDIEKLLGVDMRLPVDPNYNPTFDI